MYAKTRDGIRQKPKNESKVSLIQSIVIHFYFYSVLRKKFTRRYFQKLASSFLILQKLDANFYFQVLVSTLEL